MFSNGEIEKSLCSILEMWHKSYVFAKLQTVAPTKI